MTPSITELAIGALLETRPWIEDFFSAHGIDTARYADMSLAEVACRLDAAFFEDLGTDRRQFLRDFVLFVEEMQTLAQGGDRIRCIDIAPGYDKAGVPEPCGVSLKSGEITAVVGPTGAGKSRLLEDVECLADEDTPTRRAVRINGRRPTDEDRFASDHRFIAELSQNMNFVMDLSVGDFLTLHAESRMVEDIAHTARKIFTVANDLAGEPFGLDVPVTQLSGGQSRALMIADTALLSAAEVILIDEIENAGIDKTKALELLVSSNKIVLISTHDPLLALSAHQRIVIRNGGIQKVIVTSERERAQLVELRRLDRRLFEIRQQIRNGEAVTDILSLSSSGTECL